MNLNFLNIQFIDLVQYDRCASYQAFFNALVFTLYTHTEIILS